MRRKAHPGRDAIVVGDGNAFGDRAHRLVSRDLGDDQPDPAVVDQRPVTVPGGVVARPASTTACPSPGRTARSPALPAMPRSRKTASTTPFTTASSVRGPVAPERCTGQSRPGWSALAAVAGWAWPAQVPSVGHPPFTSHPYRRPVSGARTTRSCTTCALLGDGLTSSLMNCAGSSSRCCGLPGSRATPASVERCCQRSSAESRACGRYAGSPLVSPSKGELIHR